MSLITAIRRKRQYLMTYCRPRRLHIFVAVVVILFLLMTLPRTKQKMSIRITDTNYTYKDLLNDLKNSIIRNEGRLCEIPTLNGVAFEMKANHVPCEDTDWVECIRDECFVVDEIKKSTKVLFCIYQDMLYVNEYWYDVGKPVTLPGNVNYKLRKSDHVKVSCNGLRLRDERWPFPQLILDNLNNESSSLTQEIQWVGYKAGFRRLPPLDPSMSGSGLNILMLGLNCMSNKAFIRQMKESYVVLQQMGAVFFDGYNTVGEGISAALFPIFFGKSELQFPGESYDLKNSSIFKHLSDSGYRTAFFMDSIDDFQRRFEGFNEIPDHYLFPLLLEGYKSHAQNDNINICMGTKPLYELMLGLTYQFFQQADNRFSFTFLGSTCDNENSMNYVVDPYLANFLRSIQQEGRLKETVIFIMGNHGPKFGTGREFSQSRLEERLPFMAIVAAEGLKRTRPEGTWEALKANAKALTTPFDIHSTLVDILGVGHLRNQEKIPMASMPRGMTLLQPIPKTRTCGEAGILPHWCACMFQPKLDASEPNYLEVSLAIAKFINSITMNYRQFCKKRYLASIVTVERDFNHEHIGKVRSMGEVYQAVIEMSPDLAFYEATVTYFENGNYFEINPRHVTRISAPGETADCIKKEHPHLIDYCYCVNQFIDNLLDIEENNNSAIYLG